LGRLAESIARTVVCQFQDMFEIPTFGLVITIGGTE